MLSREAMKRCVHHHHGRCHQWQQQRTPMWTTTRKVSPSSSSNHAAIMLQRCGLQTPLRRLLHGLQESAASSSSSFRFLSFGPVRYEKGLLGWYLDMIETRPVITKSFTACGIFAVADISSQMITNKFSDSFNLPRTLRMAGYGMLILGPTLHLWFNFVSRILPKQDVLSTLKKIFIGQTVLGPIMATTFFSTNAVLQGENTTEIVTRLKRDLYPTLRNGLVYWPMADFITFKFTPVHLQPVISNTFSFFWTIYLTQMASSEKAGSSNGRCINSLQNSERKPRNDEKACVL